MADPWAVGGLGLTASFLYGGKQGSALGLDPLQVTLIEHQAHKSSSSPLHWPSPRVLGKDSQALPGASSSRSHSTGSRMIFQSRYGPSGASKVTLQSSVVAAGMWRAPAVSHGCRGHPGGEE